MVLLRFRQLVRDVPSRGFSRRLLFQLPLRKKDNGSIGVIMGIMGVTAIVLLTPLDELKLVEQKNTCYHRHLHPR